MFGVTIIQWLILLLDHVLSVRFEAWQYIRYILFVKTSEEAKGFYYRANSIFAQFSMKLAHKAPIMKQLRENSMNNVSYTITQNKWQNYQQFQEPSSIICEELKKNSLILMVHNLLHGQHYSKWELLEEKRQWAKSAESTTCINNRNRYQSEWSQDLSGNMHYALDLFQKSDSLIMNRPKFFAVYTKYQVHKWVP